MATKKASSSSPLSFLTSQKGLEMEVGVEPSGDQGGEEQGYRGPRWDIRGTGLIVEPQPQGLSAAECVLARAQPTDELFCVTMA